MTNLPTSNQANSLDNFNVDRADYRQSMENLLAFLAQGLGGVTGAYGTQAVDPAAIKLSGLPTAPTAAPGTNTTQLATTAFVKAAADAATGPWSRTGTELSPKTAGDSVYTSGEMKVGGTTAAPNITLKADGTIRMGAGTHGIQFNGDTAAENALNDYEEGTWTPTQGAALTVVGAFSSSGTYVKVGNVVHLFGKVSGATSVAAAASGAIAGNAPYPAKGGINGASGGLAMPEGNDAGTVVQFTNISFYAKTAIAATPTIYLSATYEVD
jgi:hypothetical protein